VCVCVCVCVNGPCVAVTNVLHTYTVHGPYLSALEMLRW